MASGCVSLVPSLGGTDEYIEHGINGYAVDPRDESLTYEKIKEFIELSDIERQRMINAGIETSQGFSVRKAALSEVRLFNLK